MFRSALRARYLVAVIALISFVHALGFLFVGVMRALHAYGFLLRGEFGEGEVKPGVLMLESLDQLLIALVLLIFTFGVIKVFLLPPGYDESAIPSWLRIHTLTELKALLWESILTAVLVLWVTQLVYRLREPTLELLILPGAILVLAASLFIVRRGAAREGA